MSETLKQATQETATRLVAGCAAWIGHTAGLRNGTADRCWCIANWYWLAAGFRAAGSAFKAAKQTCLGILWSQDTAKNSNGQD